MRDNYLDHDSNEVPIINLSDAPGEKMAWGKPSTIVYLWALTELLFITNPLQISSALRIRLLRLFGAKIGENVIFRPRTRVKFPWNLEIGDRSWIGEGVWIHNQDKISIGTDSVISQDTFITTGSHAHRKDMALITSPILIGSGTWITSKCVILGGSRIGQSCLVRPLSVVSGVYEANSVISGEYGVVVGKRFEVNT